MTWGSAQDISDSRARMLENEARRLQQLVDLWGTPPDWYQDHMRLVKEEAAIRSTSKCNCGPDCDWEAK